MKVIKRNQKDFLSNLSALTKRAAFTNDVDISVKQILAQVKEGGDQALVDLALKFDQATLHKNQLRVTKEEFTDAEQRTSEEQKSAINTAIQQVRAFSKCRIPKNWTFSPREGVTLGEKFSPIHRVGCYIPGGTAPLISTVVHTVTLAATAGVPEIVVATPPGKDGKINPVLLYACQQAGATEVYRVGGVYAIGALAYGTESIAKVDKIVGPGNAYVTAAKRQVYGQVALDLVAGPSEIMIVADDSANPAFVAADMLSQAEHGSGREQAVLLTTCADLLPKIEAEIRSQKDKLSRSACIDKVIANGMFLIEVKDLSEAAELASEYAPEHLELMVREPEKLAEHITGAGAIFLGH